MLSKFYSLHTHTQYSVDKSKLIRKLSYEKKLFSKATHRCKRTGNIFVLCTFGFISVEDDWCALLQSIKPDWDTDTVGVVKKHWSTMLTGTFEKKWKEDVAWQLRSWSEDLVGFSLNVGTASDYRPDGKELDFKQIKEMIASLLYYLKMVYKEKLGVGPVIRQKLAYNHSREFHMENAVKTACSSLLGWKSKHLYDHSLTIQWLISSKRVQHWLCYKFSLYCTDYCYICWSLHYSAF